MEVKEIEKLEALNYMEMVDYLRKKYGLVKGNYFLTTKCASRNTAISRYNEGLYVHHVKENEFQRLSEKKYAILVPFSYQEPENLVYCNIIEHLLLHIKIVKEYFETRYETIFQGEHIYVGIGGLVDYLIPQIVDYINGYNFVDPKLIKALQVIDDCVEKVCKIIYRFNKECTNFDNFPKLFGLLYDKLGRYYGPYFSLLHGRATTNGQFYKYIDQFVRAEITFSTFDEVKNMIDAIDDINATAFSFGRSGSHYGNRYGAFFEYKDAKGYQEYSLYLTDDVYSQIKEYINEKFSLFKFSCHEILIKKNATISYKKNDKLKNKNKNCSFVVDGISIDTAKFSEEFVKESIIKYYNSKDHC